MKKVFQFGIVLTLAIFYAPAFAQTTAFNGFCEQGAQNALTSGSPSSNKLQGIIPQCTVAIYFTGTLTKATITTDGSTPLTNPFQAKVNGQWLFYAAIGQGYDVVMSGGIPPLTYVTPLTLTGLIAGGGGSGSGLLLQHDGVNLANQALLNFNDTTPAPPTGNLNVTFQPNNGGALSAYVPMLSSQLALQYIPAAPGQYALVFAQACTTNNSDRANCVVGPGGVGYQGLVGIALDHTVSISNFTLPSYINQANVTAIYAFTISESNYFNVETSDFSILNGGGGSLAATCSNGTPTANPTFLRPSESTAYPQAQVICAFNALPTNYALISMGESTCCSGSGALTALFMGLEVHYTGTPPPANNSVLVQSPLIYNPQTNILGVSASWPNLSYATSVAALPAFAGSIPSVSFVPDGASATDCSTGSGSNLVLCYWNGSAYIGVQLGDSSSVTFATITGGTNNSAGMLVGTGASLGPTGSGTITATGLAGGALGSLPYQTAASTTGFVASPTTNGHVFVPSWSPIGSAIALSSTDLGSYLGTNVTAAAPIVATPSTLGVQFSCPSCGSSSGGTAVTINGGGALASLNINAISPVADASYLALLPKISGASAIIEAPYATSSGFGVLEGDGSTTTITAGVLKCTTATTSQLGCVKPDGSTVTISGGVISAFGGNFASLLGGTNTTAAMLVGTGASLGVSGTGTIAATSAPYSGLTGSTPTWNQSTTGNAATATALGALPTPCSVGNAPIGILANGNSTGCAPLGGSPLWSSLLNPTGNLGLTMAANTTVFTFNSATGASDLFKLQDSASNTGTGILFHVTTAGGSTETPWQADANGTGCKITSAGQFQCFGGTHIITMGANSGGLPAPLASSGSISTDASGNLFSSDAGGTFFHLCNVGNGFCVIPGVDINSSNQVTSTHLSSALPASQGGTGTTGAVFSCAEVWSGSGTASALQSGDDAISNNTCYNDSGATRTITAVKCRSSAASNTTTVNPTFGSAGAGTTILSGALTCGNSYAYSSTGTVSSGSWTTGTGIDPAMSGTLTGTSIAVLIEYHY